MNRRLFYAAIVTALCLPVLPLAAQGPSRSGAVAFVNVNVIPMDAERILTGHTVVVRGGRIVAVGPVDAVDVPEDALRLAYDGTPYLMPGMADMHVHLDHAVEDWLPLFIAAGVTTVLNLRGGPEHLVLRRRVHEENLLGPTIYTSGPFTNQPGIQTPADAERAVRDQEAAGYDLVKVHGNLTRAAFERLVEAAHEAGIAVAGHAPRNLPFDAVLEVGLPAIVHAEELLYTYFGTGPEADTMRIAPLARRAAVAGLWLTPTLSTFGAITRQWGKPAVVEAALRDTLSRYLHPALADRWTNRNPYLERTGNWVERAYTFQFPLVRQFHEAGVRLLTGTDTPLPLLTPGFSLYDEIAVLAETGLPPYHALRAATANPGAYIEEQIDPEADFGTIAVGQRADLVLLSANPLDALNTLRRPAGVMVRGRWLDRAELDRLLGDMAASFAGK